MAIDTAEKRRMAIDFGKIRGTGMPIAMGIIPVASRAHILNLYYEIPSPATIVFWRNKNRVQSSATWKGKMTPSSSWKGARTPGGSWEGHVPPPDGATQTI